MSDEKPTTIRCRQCGIIYPNTQLDKGYHRGNCVYDLKLRVQDLEDERDALKERVAEAVSVIPVIGTAVPFADEVEDEDDEPVQVSQYANEEEPFGPIGSVSGYVPQQDPQYDDEDEDEPSTGSPLR